MEQTDTTTADSSGRQRSPELVRPVQGRMVAGVAQGVANNFGISEWIPRVFFIVTAFTGGLGIALYIAGWAFIRSEDETDTPADRFFSGASTSRSWIGIGLIIIAGIIILSNFTFLSGEVIWAGAFLVLGLLLYMGYIPGNVNRNEESSSESKEGVQPMTSTDTLETETQETETTQPGDSPAGSAAPPPPPPTPSPTPPDLPPTAKPREHSILGRLTIGVMLLGMGVLAILDNIETLPIDANARHYMALAVIILGVGLLVGSIAGRARWLIILALIMVPSLIFSPVFEYNWNSDEFAPFVQPGTFDELQSVYSMDIGSLEIDLSELDWAGESVELAADGGIGNIEVRVPADVRIEGSGAVDMGRVSGPGGESYGFGNRTVHFSSPGDAGTLVLDLDLDVGNIQVFNR